MGVEYFKRPVFARRGLQVNAASTVTADVVLSSTVTGGVGVAEAVQSISLSGVSGVGSTAITNRGVTFITSTGSGAGWTLPIAAPGKKGVRKTILVSLSGASTVPVTIRTASSTPTFFGTTKNSIAFTTANSTNPHAVTLVSQTSAVWAVVSLTSAQSALIAGATA